MMRRDGLAPIFMIKWLNALTSERHQGLHGANNLWHIGQRGVAGLMQDAELLWLG